MTGPSGGPGTGGSGLPDLKQPPGQIEGAGGDPALPAGPSVSKEDKDAYDNVSDELNYMAAGWAGGMVIAGATGVEPAAIMMGLASAGCWWLAQDFNDLSDDPPQAYQHIVSFQRRAIALPGIGHPTPGMAAIGIASQYTFFGGVTVQGALMAAERLAGATAAGDYDWAVTHRGVLLQASGTIPTDLALIAAAHRAAGLAIQGTPLDGELASGPTGGGRMDCESGQRDLHIP
jgi:hypothetical protein